MFEIDVDGKINKDVGDSWGGIFLKFFKFDILDFDLLVLFLLLLDDVIGYMLIVLEK